MGNATENLFEAIEMLAKNEIHKAGFDKTIQATVVSCVDANRAKYKIKYQDSLFYAYGDTGGTTYKANDSVYILVPKNDMSLDKKIIGLVKKISTSNEEEEELIDELAHVMEIGINGLSSDLIFPDEFPYLLEDEEEQLILYPGKININNNAIKASVNESNKIKLSADFKVNIDRDTELNGEEGSGNFGLLFQIKFKNSNNEEIEQTIKFDNTQFLGYPYSILNFTTKYMLIDYDKTDLEFVAITKIILFAKNFNVGVKPLTNKKIQVKNLKFIGCYAFSPQVINSAHVELTYLTGNFFPTGPVKIQSKLVQSQNIISSDISNPIYYFWFKEDCRVDFDHPRYCSYGGIGWYCLNEFKEGNWQSATDTYNINSSDVNIREQKFKCVIVRNNMTYERIFSIYNYKKSELFLIFNPSNIVENTMTTPLSVTMNENGEDYKYYWITKKNTFTFDPTKIDIEHLNKANGINKKEIFISVKNINDGASVMCGISHMNGELEEYIGTASSTLSVVQGNDGDYDIYINQAQQSFIYTENGDSPTELGTGRNYTVIRELSFQIIDKKKQIEIDSETACNSEGAIVEWLIPVENSLLKPTNSSLNAFERNGKLYYILEGPRCSFAIAKSYDYTKYDNNIELRVIYKGQLLRSITNFYFGKQGEIGTNGTDVSIKVSGVNSINPYRFPIVTKIINKGYYSNFYGPDLSEALPDSAQWFKTIIESRLPDIQDQDASINIKDITYSFVGLTASHHSGNKEKSYKSFIAVDTDGTFTIPAVTVDHPTNIEDLRDIIQVHIITNDGMHHYTYIPLTTIVIPNEYENYNIELTSGYNFVQYDSNGKNPKYTGERYFTLLVNNGTDYITNSCEYEWKLVLSDTKTPSFKISNLNNLSKNQYSISPMNECAPDDYSTALFCTIKLNEEVIGTIHIPIFCYLNMYSQEHINNWDGNNIIVDEQNGYATAVQFAAGDKDNDNKFTGVYLGTYREGNSKLIGLLGQSKGQRSFFIDAETGKIEIGTAQSGKLLFEPNSTNELIIESSVYDTKQKTGLRIKFGLDPEIRYGSGNFIVDKDGHIIAKGADIQGDFRAGSNNNYILLRDGNRPVLRWHYEEDGTSLDINNARITIRGTGNNNYFGVDDGRLTLKGDFNWSNTLNGWDEYSGEYKNYKGSATFNKSGINITYEDYIQLTKFKLNSNGLYIGSTDSTKHHLEYANGNLTITGKINATSGTIGGWVIEEGRIYSGKTNPNDKRQWNGIELNAITGSITQRNDYTSTEEAYKSVISTYSTKEKVELSGGVINFYAISRNKAYLQGAIYTRDSNKILPHQGTSFNGALTISSRLGMDGEGSPVIIGAANNTHKNGQFIACFFPDNDDEETTEETTSDRCLCIPTFIKSTTYTNYSELKLYSSKLYRDRIQTGDWLVPYYYLKKNKKLDVKYGQFINKNSDEYKNNSTLSIFDIIGTNTPKRINYTDGSSYGSKTLRFGTKTNSENDIKTFSGVTTDIIELQYTIYSEQENQIIEVYVQNKGEDEEKVVGMKLPTGEIIDLSEF